LDFRFTEIQEVEHPPVELLQMKVHQCSLFTVLCHAVRKRMQYPAARRVLSL
jgi:hypothetical protein